MPGSLRGARTSSFVADDRALTQVVMSAGASSWEACPLPVAWLSVAAGMAFATRTAAAAKTVWLRSPWMTWGWREAPPEELLIEVLAGPGGELAHDRRGITGRELVLPVGRHAIEVLPAIGTSECPAEEPPRAASGRPSLPSRIAPMRAESIRGRGWRLACSGGSRSTRPLRSCGVARRDVAAEHEVGTAPFQDQVHVRAFVFDYLSTHATGMIDWAHRTRQALHEWPHLSDDQRAHRAVGHISQQATELPAPPVADRDADTERSPQGLGRLSLR